MNASDEPQALPWGDTPTPKAEKGFGKIRGCSATPPHVEGTFSSLPQHSIALSATGASLIALLMIFTLHPQGLEKITSQHSWAGLKGWVAPALLHFFSPPARAQGFLHRDTTFLGVLQLLGPAGASPRTL